MERKKVLFVCSANTCRSAAAEALLRRRGGECFAPSSAGLYAKEGEPMMEGVRSALSEYLGEAVGEEHRSRRLTAKMMEESDMVVGVSRGYGDILRALYPEYAEKITYFPDGIADISLLWGDALTDALRRIDMGIETLFSEAFCGDRDS